VEKAKDVKKKFEPGHGDLSLALSGSLRDKTVEAGLQYRHHILEDLSAYAVAGGRYSPRGPDVYGSLGLVWEF